MMVIRTGVNRFVSWLVTSGSDTEMAPPSGSFRQLTECQMNEWANSFLVSVMGMITYIATSLY